MLSRIIFIMSVFRSYLFCLRHLPFQQAKMCPILFHWRTKTYVSKDARLLIDCPQKYGVRIGIWGGSYAKANRRTNFQMFDKAVVRFQGPASFSKGTHVIARGNAHLEVGEHFFCNANCDILCNKLIRFGQDNLLGWNITLLDSDGHNTIVNGKCQEASKSILLGNHIWIGAESSILKGVSLAKGTIVPYGSIIHKSNDSENVVFQNKVLKSDIVWK